MARIFFIDCVICGVRFRGASLNQIVCWACLDEFVAGLRGAREGQQ